MTSATSLRMKAVEIIQAHVDGFMIYCKLENSLILYLKQMCVSPSFSTKRYITGKMWLLTWISVAQISRFVRQINNSISFS